MSSSTTSPSFSSDSAANAPRVLRWWPPIVLILLMLGLRWMPGLFEAPSLPVFLAAFMGPAFLGGGIVVWWLFFSKATWSERFIGLIGLGAVAGVCVPSLHQSMTMAPMFFQFPVGLGAFGLAAALFATSSRWRVTAAIVSAALGFGYWDLLRSEGVTGKFTSQFLWRWNDSSEERYLATLAKSKPSKSETATEPSNNASSSGTTIPPKPMQVSWGGFRGSDRGAVQADLALTETWAQIAPKQLWKRPIGPAWSSFAVGDGVLFTQEQRGEKEAVVCMDAKTGETIWDYEYASRFWEPVAGTGPRATPTVLEDGTLYALGANGSLVCLNASTGKLLWEQDLQKDSQRQPPTWGFSSSPLVVNGIVIVHAGGANDLGLMAYRTDSGATAWHVASGDHTYSSPQLASFFGEKGILMLTNKALQFVRIEDGSTIWQYDDPSQNYRVLQPLVINNTIIVGSSLGEGTQRVEVCKDGSNWTIKSSWKTRDMKGDFNDFVMQDGCLFGFDSGIFGCVDLENGKRAWKKGRYGSGQVLSLPSKNQLLVLSEQGELVLLRANKQKLEELSRIQAIDGKTWNHPVVVGNRIYVRNAEQAAALEF